MANTWAGAGLVIVGGGGHALVVADAARLVGGLEPSGCLDDAPEPAACRGAGALPRLGALADLEAHADAGGAWILGLGDVALRRRVLERLAGPARVGGAHTVVHPSASVSGSASVGRGVYVGPMAVVHTRARVGEHAIVNSGAIVEHDVRVGENTHVAIGALLAGGSRVGTGTLVGAGAVVLPGVGVGDGCVVGAGAVVREDVGNGQTVVGVPARAR